MEVSVSVPDLTDDDIVEAMQEVGTTSSPEKAIFVLRDGTLISGNFRNGIRSEDHVCIERCFHEIDRYTDNFWEFVFEATNVVLLVPENAQAVYPDWYRPTYRQQEIIDNLRYEVANDF